MPNLLAVKSVKSLALASPCELTASATAVSNAGSAKLIGLQLPESPLDVAPPEPVVAPPVP
jgi:hypothetical protein